MSQGGLTITITEIENSVRRNQIHSKESGQEHHQEFCPDCGCTEFDVDDSRAEISCKRCGYIIEENMIDRGRDWVAYNNDQLDKRARTGAPSTFTISDKGLSTTIDFKNKDIKGNAIPERNTYLMYRLRKLNKRMRVSGTGERNLAFALSQLDRESSKLGIPRDVREDAALIYRTAAKKNLVRGRSIEGIVAASLYIACRRAGIPRSLDEISQNSDITKKQLGKNYRFLARQLKIKLTLISPADYVPRFASNLGLSGKVESYAIDIINQSRQKGLLSGCEPTGVAAAALYISSVLLGERKTQKEIAEISGVTEVTIRNRFKQLSQQLQFASL